MSWILSGRVNIIMDRQEKHTMTARSWERVYVWKGGLVNLLDRVRSDGWNIPGTWYAETYLVYLSYTRMFWWLTLRPADPTTHPTSTPTTTQQIRVHAWSRKVLFWFCSFFLGCGDLSLLGKYSQSTSTFLDLQKLFHTSSAPPNKGAVLKGVIHVWWTNTYQVYIPLCRQLARNTLGKPFSV